MFARDKGQTVASFRKKKWRTVNGEWTHDPRSLGVVLPSTEEGRKEIEGTLSIVRDGFGFVANRYFLPAEASRGIRAKSESPGFPNSTITDSSYIQLANCIILASRLYVFKQYWRFDGL